MSSDKAVREAAVLALVKRQPEARTESELVELYQTQQRAIPGAPELTTEQVSKTLSDLRSARKIKAGEGETIEIAA